MRHFDLVIFDLDGVLADSTPAHARAYMDLWFFLGLEGPSYESIAGRTTREVIAEYTAALGPTDGQLAEWVGFKQERARSYLTSETIRYPDAVPALDALAAHGIPLALGTGASRETAMTVLKHLRLTERFRAIVTGEDVVTGKPSPETYELALARAGAQPGRTLVVEDSAAGVTAGLGAGAWVTSVRTGVVASAERFIGSYPDLKALLAVLGIEVACAV